uniref:Beta-soluble NSF attachment protein isoform X1 n=1 Tax=Camelus bactrianus TaxID=9837 RepID=A0A9W3H9K5_CAMBA|nr:beta-soluble NSF attachment protein isoform X1 [Camelus bactrianus]
MWMVIPAKLNLICKFFFRGNTRIEEACEMYTRAANMFKMAKNWSAAGNAFCQAAKLHMQLQSKHDSATSFVDAGNAYKKADPQEAINCLNAAIDIYTDMGRFTIAAKHHITIAEIYETELVDIEKAIAHYEQSADYYKGEESNSSANKCLLKVAAYAAQLEQYQRAVEIYEQVGASTMDNPLLKYSAKDYFFKAALCHFIVDELNAKLALEKYEEMFPAFTDSRECKLLKKLLEAHEEQNSEAYTEAVSSPLGVARFLKVQVTEGPFSFHCGNAEHSFGHHWGSPKRVFRKACFLAPTDLAGGPSASHAALAVRQTHVTRGCGSFLGCFLWKIIGSLNSKVKAVRANQLHFKQKQSSESVLLSWHKINGNFFFTFINFLFSHPFPSYV